MVGLLGIDLTTVWAASGFLALAAGFASKNIVENILSGGMLRFEKVIRPGDLIVISNRWIHIHHVGLRITTAHTSDGEEVLIPNSLIAQSIIENLTRNDRLYRLQIEVGVSYDSDLNLVRNTLEQVIDNLSWRTTLKKSELFLIEFAPSSINYSIDVWIDEANDAKSRKSILYEAVWFALKEQNITIAYPQLDLHIDRNIVCTLEDRKDN